MAKQLFQYDPNEVSFEYDGHRATGVADGTFIMAEMNEDAYTVQVGSDGQATRTRNHNRSATFTLTLIHDSLSNEVFRAKHYEDLANTGQNAGALFEAGGGSLMIKNIQGQEIMTAEKAWIRKMPAYTYEKEQSTREWVFETHDAEHKLNSDAG